MIRKPLFSSWNQNKVVSYIVYIFNTTCSHFEWDLYHISLSFNDCKLQMYICLLLLKRSHFYSFRFLLINRIYLWYIYMINYIPRGQLIATTINVSYSLFISVLNVGYFMNFVVSRTVEFHCWPHFIVVILLFFELEGKFYPTFIPSIYFLFFVLFRLIYWLYDGESEKDKIEEIIIETN